MTEQEARIIYCYKLLRNAIVTRACQDYVNAARLNNKSSECNRLRKFFKSEWAMFLCSDENGNSYDPKKLITSLDYKAEYLNWRAKHKCGSCKCYDCKHNGRKNYYLRYNYNKIDLKPPKCRKDKAPS